MLQVLSLNVQGVVAVASKDGAKKAGADARRQAINLAEWQAALKLLGLAHSDMSERDATRCFSWSRMAVGTSATHAERPQAPVCIPSVHAAHRRHRRPPCA